MNTSSRNSFATLAFCSAVGIAPDAAAAPVYGQGTWESTLQARDINGDSIVDAYYDTVQDITWLADVSYGGSAMTWSAANAWAAALDVHGITGWRLPSITDLGSPGCNYAYSGTDCGYNLNTASGELAHLYYETLDNTPFCSATGTCPQPGYGVNLNTANFYTSRPFTSQVYSLAFWSGTENAQYGNQAWYFSFNAGSNGSQLKTQAFDAWAVHSGDVGASTVPVPAAAWLFGSGLLGLIGVARRKAA